MRVLVVGLGVTGDAVVRHAAAQGWDAVVVEDAPGRPGYDERRKAASALGVPVVERPTRAALGSLVRGVDLVVPSPGVPKAHPVFDEAATAGVEVVAEIELAARGARVPIVAVTGTNAKTTVTTLVARMLDAWGVRAVPAGNIGHPLLEAVHADADVVVAEVSSFQLEFTRRFHARVAAILNLAADHLDWHDSLEAYGAAKARVFANQAGDDLAVLNGDDEQVRLLGARAPARVMWFSLAAADPGAYHVASGMLRVPGGEAIVPVDGLPRHRPHDVENALAAVAVARETAARLGHPAPLDVAADTLRGFTGLPHRLTLVGEAGGVEWYDDSKATNPHATLQALRGFRSVVLLAGGRNKGLSLEALRAGAGPVRAVVAFGESGPEVAAAFRGLRPVEVVAGVAEAVEVAATLARPGDAVLLSPACASFDAYVDYAARGDDFAAAVHRLLDRAGARPGGARGESG